MIELRQHEDGVYRPTDEPTKIEHLEKHMAIWIGCIVVSIICLIVNIIVWRCM